MSLLSRWREKYANVAPTVKEVVDSVDGTVMQVLEADGSETLDATPIAPPVGYNRQVPLHLQIREMVRSEALRQAAESSDAETFEEADDFEVDDDDYDPQSQWENEFDPSYREIAQEVEKEVKQRATKSSKAPNKDPSGDQPETVTEPPQEA